jgi:hypothetical protein
MKPRFHETLRLVIYSRPKQASLADKSREEAVLQGWITAYAINWSISP